MTKAKHRNKKPGFAFAVGRRYQLRSGEIVTLISTRPALDLGGKAREPIMQGKFSDGCFIAFKPDGTYRPASGPHELDIVKESKCQTLPAKSAPTKRRATKPPNPAQKPITT